MEKACNNNEIKNKRLIFGLFEIEKILIKHGVRWRSENFNKLHEELWELCLTRCDKSEELPSENEIKGYLRKYGKLRIFSQIKYEMVQCVLIKGQYAVEEVITKKIWSE